MLQRFFLLLMLPVFTLAPFANAETRLNDSVAFLDNWHITGENSIFFDYYDTHGFDGGSIYPFDGKQIYSEHRHSFDRQFSDYETVSGSFTQVINSSDYRSDQQGWFVEDARIEWEKGDGFVPFRANLGDFTANLTYRTIVTSLKGVQVEVQPEIQIGDLEQRHSVIAFSGINTDMYRDIEIDRDLFSGTSWLVDLGQFGAAAFNFVHNSRDDGTADILAQRNQLVWSFSYENIFDVLEQELAFETEIAKFIGDYDNTANFSQIEHNASDTAFYLNLDGSNDTPLTYGFRFENYGDHFQPNGSVVSPDRRTLEWTAGWAFENGMNLDGRIQLYRDNLESDNHLNTKTYGLTFSGPIENPLLENLNIYADVYRQSLNDTLRFTNLYTWVYNFDSNATLYEEWTGHFGFNSSRTDNNFNGSRTIPREFDLDVSHPVRIREMEGTARLGTIFRNATGGFIASDEFVPTASLSLTQGNHSVDVNAGWSFRDSHVVGSANVIGTNFKSKYGYSRGPHRFGVDFEFRNRNPSTVKPTQDYRVGMFYTFSFDKPVGTNAADFTFWDGYQPPAARTEEVLFEHKMDGMLWFEAIAPGAQLNLAKKSLAQLGIRGGSEQDGRVIYEERVLRDISRRQRLVLDSEDGTITRATVIIDLGPSGDVSTVQQIFAKAQKAFLDAYGNPSLNIEEGNFGPGFVQAINDGTLKRVTEWKTPNGVIRLGIPRRLDERVRIEIQRALSFDSARNPRWSNEQII